jgi:4'-phosphopantetheinyl transferase
MSAALMRPRAGMHIPAEFYELPADAAHVLCLNVSSHRLALEAGLAALDSAERERAARYVDPWHGRRYASTRGLLRLVLGRFLQRAPADVKLAYGPHGKPELDGEDRLDFNLSHCGDWAAMGFARGRRVGIDLERLADSRDCLAVARQCFTVRELTELDQGVDKVHAFCAIWVRKEAVLKAAGQGLDRMRTFCTSEPIVSLPDARGAPLQWHVSDMPMVGGHHMALAVEGGAVRNRCFLL